MEPKKPSTPKKGSTKDLCMFCGDGKGQEEFQGKLLSKSGVTAHYFCMLFSSGLSQNGESEKQGLLGFMPADVTKEVRRGSRLRCSFCKKHGGTIGCVQKMCKKNFHLGCGRENGAFHLYYDTFSSYCADHRPKQKVPAEKDSNIVCSICMNVVKAAPCIESLRAPCCQKNWYHRDCIQTYSKSAGLYFFKCPLCNNKDDFQKEMLTYGIYIPDQDAAWETEPNAYHELLERYQTCDAKTCKCVEGRNYDKEGSKWEIELCNACGSQGSHAACKFLVKHRGQHFCPDCLSVAIETKGKGVCSPKSPSLKKLQSHCANSPEQTKENTSEYPGPSSNSMKRRLPSKFSSAKKPRMSLGSKSTSSTSKHTKSDKIRHSVSPIFPRQKGSNKDSNEKSNVKRYQGKISNGNSKFMDRYFNSKQSSPSSSEESSMEETSGSSSNLLSYLNNNQLMSAFDLKKSKKHRRQIDKMHKSTIKMEVENDNNEVKMCKMEASPDNLKNGEHSSQGKKKRHSDQKNTLDSWLKGPQKPCEKLIPEQTLEYIDGQILDISSKSADKKGKKPTVIEWRGKQLILRHSKVLLRRRTLDKKWTKPKKLAIDMVDEKGNPQWDAELDVLSNIDADIRVTRNMINSSTLDDLSTFKPAKKVKRRWNRRSIRSTVCETDHNESSLKPYTPSKGNNTPINSIEKLPFTTGDTILKSEEPLCNDSPAKNLRLRKCSTITSASNVSSPSRSEKPAVQEVINMDQTSSMPNKQDSSRKNTHMGIEGLSMNESKQPNTSITICEDTELNNNCKQHTEHEEEKSPDVITGTSMFNFSQTETEHGANDELTDVPSNKNIEALKRYNFDPVKLGNTRINSQSRGVDCRPELEGDKTAAKLIGSSNRVVATSSLGEESPSRITRSLSLQIHSPDKNIQGGEVLNVQGDSYRIQNHLHDKKQTSTRDSCPSRLTIPATLTPAGNSSETETASSLSENGGLLNDSPARSTRSASLQIRHGSNVRKVFDEILTSPSSMRNGEVNNTVSNEGNTNLTWAELKRKQNNTSSEVKRRNNNTNENQCPKLSNTNMTKLKNYLIKRFEKDTQFGNYNNPGTQNDQPLLNNEGFQRNISVPTQSEISKPFTLSPRSLKGSIKDPSRTCELPGKSPTKQTKSDFTTNDISVMSAYYSPITSDKTKNNFVYQF